MNMAFLYRFLDDEMQYKECVNKAVDINPHHARSLSAKGILYLTDSEYDNAIDSFYRAYEIDPSKVPFYETMRLFCYLGKNDWANANQSVDRSMRENDHSRFYAFKAAILAHENKLDESKEWLKKYLDNRPEIKTLADYEKVVPELNQDVTDILLKGLKIAGLN